MALGPAPGRMPAKERSYFVAIAAGRHGAPAAAVGARVIVEKKAASGIRAAADGRTGAFDEKIGGGAGHGGEQPFEAALAGNELERPRALAKDELVMPFGDAQNFVDGLGPGRREGLFVDHASEDPTERLAKAESAEEYGVDRARFGCAEGAKTRGAVLRNQTGVYEEGDKVVPGEIARGRNVSEIEGQTTRDKGRLRIGCESHERASWT